MLQCSLPSDFSSCLTAVLTSLFYYFLCSVGFLLLRSSSAAIYSVSYRTAAHSAPCTPVAVLYSSSILYTTVAPSYSMVPAAISPDRHTTCSRPPAPINSYSIPSERMRSRSSSSSCCYEMLCMICIAQIQPRKHVLDHADSTASTRPGNMS